MYERELAVARETAERAGEIIARYCGGTDLVHWDKAEDSPVTEADLEANAAIERSLRASFPDDAILSEETVDMYQRRHAERLWIVDPLDGTKELIAGIPEFAVSVGLSVAGEPVVGCIYQPTTGECFWAARDGGAFLDGERITVSDTDELSRATLLASRSETKRGDVEPYARLFGRVVATGSAAVKLAHVACGRGDLWVSTAAKNEWDVCAGDAVLREAGGTLVTLGAGARSYNQEKLLLEPLIVAGPANLVREFAERSREL
ncbi:MAG: 3'(2'),5'-bisphosphate nucleotidase CysQ [Myxococcota bacterium]